MHILVIDANSLVNRAYYGVKPLTTKDGRFTNAIHGFMNMLLKLREEYPCEAVAVAFDRREPTFRHQLYDGYKAGRKGMPPELAQQMQPLKDLLAALGYPLVELAGYEADDILGTLAACTGEADTCYIATGDRDALQLVRERVHVLLTTTKMGRPAVVDYTPARVQEEYLVTPPQLVELKALMGDSSDNIPGVAGIGQKTASELISRFGSIDFLYDNLDTLDIKPGVKNKLAANKENAFLSRDLGRICTEVPVATSIEAYRVQPAQSAKAASLLAQLEMFRLLERLDLTQEAAPAAAQKESEKTAFAEETDTASLLARLRTEGAAYFLRDADGNLYFSLPGTVVWLAADHPQFMPFWQAVLEDAAITKYTDNAKDVYKDALRLDMLVRGQVYDSAVCAYILNPDVSSYALERLLTAYGLSAALADPQAPPAAIQCASLQGLFAALLAKIQENAQEDLLCNIELPLCEVLAEMEYLGFAVDTDGIAAYGESLQARIAQIEEDIYAQVGYTFNLNSPKQLGVALFETLGLPARKKTKTGYSTNAEVLESLAQEHPVVSSILEYRTLAKLNSTYCEGLLKVVAPDGRIHSTLHQTETRTGRISSAEPNLQNIPVKTDLGRELRRFFRAKPGYVLVDADYSQIELRVLAHIAEDAAMIEAFNQEEDIHTITASQVFGMPPQMVTPLMRSRAKAVNFGIVYGISAFSLSNDIGVSVAEADSYIKGYLAHYAGVEQYMQTVVEQAKENGYVETLFGRRRYLPELTASNFNTRSFGERVARNMPIQGTAADIIKIAMIRVHKRLRDENFAARLILQVHDELLIEAPRQEEKAVRALLQQEMEHAAELRVQLAVDVGAGETWYDAKG